MKLQLNPIIANGAVFAANKPIRIFGIGDGHVAVDFLGEHAETEGQNGTWLIKLSPRPDGGPYEMTVTLNGEAVQLTDLYVGEVLLLSGQSNMSFRMNESADLPFVNESLDTLRLFSAENVHKNGYFRPQNGWMHCSDRDVIEHCSAIGYEVGLSIAKKKGCAVGLISAAQGASVIQSWLPVGALDRLGIRFKPEELHNDHTGYPTWNGDGILYNTMIRPSVPYSLSHVIWYQGESNASVAESRRYKEMLCELIRVWRSDFVDATLPFVIVQLADTEKRMRHHDGWITVQKAQAEISSEVAGVQTVVSRDVCESDDIHPPTKRFLAERIANII